MGSRELRVDLPDADAQLTEETVVSRGPHAWRLFVLPARDAADLAVPARAATSGSTESAAV